MIRVPAYAKINLTLDVLGRRTDGYHEIDSLVQTVAIRDLLTLESAQQMSIKIEGYDAPQDDRNLVWQACVIVLKRYGLPGAVEASIAKGIPAQAGLGGASSDAAAALVGACRLFGVKPTYEELHDMAGCLGSDVTFFLVGGTARIMGRGERVQILPDLPPLELVVVWPGFGVSTAEAYRRLDETGFMSGMATEQAVEAVSRGDVEGLTLSMSNDFERVVFRDHPELQRIAEELQGLGAAAAHLCGSGSSVFGVFKNAEAAGTAAGQMKKHYRDVWAVRTLGRLERQEQGWPVL